MIFIMIFIHKVGGWVSWLKSVVEVLQSVVEVLQPRYSTTDFNHDLLGPGPARPLLHVIHILTNHEKTRENCEIKNNAPMCISFPLFSCKSNLRSNICFMSWRKIVNMPLNIHCYPNNVFYKHSKCDKVNNLLIFYCFSITIVEFKKGVLRGEECLPVFQRVCPSQCVQRGNQWRLTRKTGARWRVWL
jgi:hypothetical protein